LSEERALNLSNDVKVRVIDEGTGPIVLLLHGNPDNADEWRPLIRRLRDQFRCIAPDLPGYGRRGRTFPLPPSFDYSLGQEVGFVDEVLRALEVKDPVLLVVHDIGGIMGVPWAAANTARVRGVMFTNTVAYSEFEWFELARRWGKTSDVGRTVGRLSMAAMGAFDAAIFRAVFGRQNPQLSRVELNRFVEDFAKNDVAKETTLCQFRELTRPRFFADYDDMVRRISDAVPTATLWGEGDPYVDIKYARRLSPHTTILEGRGHWVPIVASEELAAEIVELAARS
jgi:pimeloyl-ACP methyl ester carboxylesterase